MEGFPSNLGDLRIGSSGKGFDKFEFSRLFPEITWPDEWIEAEIEFVLDENGFLDGFTNG